MWMYHIQVLAVSLLFVGSYAQIVYAEEASSKHSIPEVIITADPLGAVESHIAQPVNVLDKEELKKRHSRNIGEAIANEPGVTSSDFGPGVGRPIIRGLGGSRVSVLENGISTLDVASISSDHGVPTEAAFARQVEIFRGPSTLLFGSGASAGVVNVVNDRLLHEIPESLEGELSVQYETVSTGITAGGSINAGAGDFALHLDGLIRDTEDYDIPGFAELEPDEPGQGSLNNSAVNTETVAGGLSYVGERGFIGVAISHYSNKYGVPGGHEHEEHEEAGHAEETDSGVIIDLQQIRYDVEAALYAPLPGIRKVKTRWAYNDYEHDEIEPSGEIGTAFANDEFEGRLEFVHSPLGQWHGVFGLQYRHKDFSVVGEEAFVPPSELESIGLFILEKGDFGRWHVELGARYEHQDSESITGADAEHDLFSASVGLSWDYSDNYRLGLTVTQAQRAPAIEESFSNGPHLATTTFEIGNPTLDKEKSSNIDVYWQKTAGRLTFSANFFYNMIDNFIFLQEQDLNNDGFADRVEEDFSGDPADILDADEDQEPLLVVQSQNDADFFGFELEAGLRLIEDHRGTLDVRLWTDYVQGEQSNHVYLARVTPWRLGAGLTYQSGGWLASLDYTRVNEQTDTAPLETATSGYNSLNLYTAYTLTFANTDVTVFARVTNLFDEEIRRHTSFVKHIAPLPGRSGIVGIRSRF